MNVQLSLAEFNLKSFLKDSQRNGEGIMTPSAFRVKSPDNFNIGEPEDEKAELLYKYLIEEDGYVYVNFSSSYVDRDIECIDGNSYFYIEKDDVEFEFEDEDEIPEGLQPVKNLQLYEDTSVGYLLQYKDTKLHIQSGIFHLDGSGSVGPCELRALQAYSTFEPKDDLELFNIPMKDYLGNFTTSL